MSMRTKVMSGYRRLFRARKFLFEGDQRALAESRVAIRAEFDKNRHETNTNTLAGLLVMIDEAEDMLRHGFMRGELNQRSGNYEIKVKPEHTQDMPSPEMDKNNESLSLNNSTTVDEKNDVVITKSTSIQLPKNT